MIHRQTAPGGGSGARLAVVAALAAALAAGCTSGSTVAGPVDSGAAGASPQTTRPDASPVPSDGWSVGTPGCGVDANGVPNCGVLWGVATRPPTMAGVEEVEKAAGRSFDFVYRYHDLNDEIPDAAERQVVASGRMLHIAIAARDFAAADGAKLGWKAVSSGAYDENLRAQARGVKSIGQPVYVTFEQEANQQRKRAELGSPEQFKAAWRHVHDLYVSEGVSNAVWVWVMTGSDRNLDAAMQMWPGNDVVDWISWNVYNQSGCASGETDPAAYVSFGDKLSIFYDYLQAHGSAAGIDLGKPMMISEAGSAKYLGDLSKTAQWYAEIPDTLRRFPQIKALALWNSIDETCDYKFSASAEVSLGVVKAGKDPKVQSGRRVKPLIGAGTSTEASTSSPARSGS